MTDYEIAVQDLADSTGVKLEGMTDYEKALLTLTPSESKPSTDNFAGMTDYEIALAEVEAPEESTIKDSYGVDDLATDASDFLKAGVSGLQHTMKFAGDVGNFFNPLTPAYPTPDMERTTSENIAKADALLENPKGYPAYAGRILMDPMNLSPLGLADDAAKLVSKIKPMDAANKLLGKVTGPIVDKTTDVLTRASPAGSVPDRLKTLFIQDYKLPKDFVKMVDTRLRTGRVQNDDALEPIYKLTDGLSSKNKEIVQYLVSGDRIAHPEIAELMKTSSGKHIAKHFNLYSKANAMKNTIRSNQKDLLNLGLLESRQVKQGPELPNNSGVWEPTYVNHAYQDRKALEGNMNPSLRAGRTIPGRRGMYDTDGNFIRSFTNTERSIMKPKTERVAEKTIGYQLDDKLQGQMMDEVANYQGTFYRRHKDSRGEFDDVWKRVMKPEDFAKKIGRTPDVKEQGYTLLQGKDYGNLSGHYVQDQMANRLKSMVDDINAEPTLWNHYRKYVSEWKANVTIKNPKTHINNMLGNAGMMITASDIPASKLHSILSDGIKIHGEGKANTVYNSARRSGLLEGTKVQELANMKGIGSGQKGSREDFWGEMNTRSIYLGSDSKMGKPIFDAYQAEDEVFKLGIYDHYLKQGKTPTQAREATELIVFDYAKKLPKGVEFLRDTGLIPFVTWSYRSLPMFADVLKNRPAQLALTASALALMNERDDSLTEPTVGSRKINTKNVTPYMEYLDPQQFLSDQTLSGIPQQVAAVASGNKLNFGRMRTLDKKGMEPIDQLLGRTKALYDLMPVPDVYNDIYDIATDKRDVVDSSIHRLLFTNYPKKTSRKRKKTSRSKKRN